MRHPYYVPMSLVVCGWRIFAHPLFLRQVEMLAAEVERLRAGKPAGYAAERETKLLAAISKLAFDVIPSAPANPAYRQLVMRGEERKHWFRARFFKRFTLFFRYHTESRIIVYAWVKDEDAKRACESGADAYRTFRRMLEGGHPPDNWDALLREARAAGERWSRRAGRARSS